MRALTALRLVSSGSRSSPANPSRSLGIAVASPASTARGVLGVSRIALAAPPPPPGAVRAVDLPDLDAAPGQQLRQPVSAAPGSLHPGITRRAQPGQPAGHLHVPGIGSGEVPHRQAVAEPVQHHRHVHILARINPDDQIFSHQRHASLPGLGSNGSAAAGTGHSRRASGNAPIGSLGDAVVDAGRAGRSTQRQETASRITSQALSRHPRPQWQPPASPSQYWTECRITPYLDQGGACGAASGAPRAGLCLGGPPGAPAPSRSESGSDLYGFPERSHPSSSASIVRLAAATSRAALRAVARDRLRRPWTRQPLTWFWRLRGGRVRNEGGKTQMCPRCALMR